MFLLLLLLDLSFACQKCYWENNLYSCGAESNCKICCNGIWRKCEFHPQDGCTCPSCGYLNNKKILNQDKIENDYILTDNFIFSQGKLVTTTLTLVKKVKKNLFQIIENIHSKNINIGDNFIWPGHDIGSLKKNKILKLEYQNVTNMNNRCCTSIKIPFTPYCAIQTCCGDGCCC